MHPSTSELDEAIFTAIAENTSGVNGTSRVVGGMTVEVRSPTQSDRDGATNPEELLALSWATCLNAAARIVAGPGAEVTVRTSVALHTRLDGDGFEFSAHAELCFEGTPQARADELARAAHARCPVSRMLAGRSPVSVRAVADPALGK